MASEALRAACHAEHLALAEVGAPGSWALRGPWGCEPGGAGGGKALRVAWRTGLGAAMGAWDARARGLARKGFRVPPANVELAMLVLWRTGCEAHSLGAPWPGRRSLSFGCGPLCSPKFRGSLVQASQIRETTRKCTKIPSIPTCRPVTLILATRHLGRALFCVSRRRSKIRRSPALASLMQRSFCQGHSCVVLLRIPSLR